MKYCNVNAGQGAWLSAKPKSGIWLRNNVAKGRYIILSEGPSLSVAYDQSTKISIEK